MHPSQQGNLRNVLRDMQKNRIIPPKIMTLRVMTSSEPELDRIPHRQFQRIISTFKEIKDEQKFLVESKKK